MANAYLTAGDTVTFPLAFNIPIKVNTQGGTPYLKLFIGTVANVRRAYYTETVTYNQNMPGTGSCSLIFSYTIQPTDPSGVISTSGVVVNGASIVSYANQQVSLAGIPASATNYSVSPSANNLSQLLYGLNLGENVAITGLEGPADSTFSSGTLRSGVGDGDDLLVDIVADHTGRWVPKIHSGFFYYNGEECYLFGKKAITTASNVVPYVPNSHAASIYLNPQSDEIYYENDLITHYGPIFVKELLDNGTYRPFTHIASPMRANIQTTISALDMLYGTGLYRVRIDGIPVQIKRVAEYTEMHRVWTLEGVTSPEEYYIEMEYTPSENGFEDIIRYYALVTSDDALEVTYAIADIENIGTPNDPFIQYELCRLDENLQVRLMYRSVMSPPDINSVLRPTATRITQPAKLTIPILPPADLPISNTATIIGNVVTFTSGYTAVVNSVTESYTLKAGDEVAVSYYVEDAFTVNDLEADTTGIQVMSSRSVIPSLQVEYEGAPDGWWRSDRLKSVDNSYTQFNPLKDGVSPGFLYIMDITDESKVASKLEIITDAVGPLVFNTTNQTSDVARFKIRVTDNDKNAIPYMPINLSLSTTGAFLCSLYPLTSSTDWKGELSGTLQSEVSGSITITASGVGASGSTIITYYDKLAYLAGSTNLTGALGYKVILTKTDIADYAGTIRITARVSDISGAYPIANVAVGFHSNLGRFTNSNTVNTNADGVATTYYYPVVGDEIYATYGYIQSNSVIVESVL